jgi:hypothetical protein
VNFLGYKMIIKFQKLPAFVVSFALLMPSIPFVNAANHPYSQIIDKTNNNVKVSDLEFTVNLDWDPDVPPSISGVDKDGNTITNLVLNRSYIKNVLDTVAKTVYTMTEGRHRVSTFYVYKNSLYGNNVDIRIINKEGRSNASVSGFNRNGFTSNNYTIQGKNGDVPLLETERDLGQVIAHELGHYFYGLYDEYREVGGKSPWAGFPRDEDTPKDTLMNDQYKFATLSTAAEYSDPEKRKTAQARVYGKSDGTGGSHWEVLTRPKSQDTDEALKQDGSINRLEFVAFKGLNFPNQASLSKPDLTNDQLPIISYINPTGIKNIILVDTTVPTNQLEKMIEAATGIIGKATNDGSTGLFRSTLQNDSFEVQGLINNSTGKQNLITQLNNLKAAGSGGEASADSLTAAINALGDRSTNINNPANITLLMGDNLTISEAAAKLARERKIALNIVRFTDNAPSTPESAGRATNVTKNLEMVAKISGGAFNSARSGAEAAKEASRELATAEQNLVLIDNDGTEPLEAGQKLTSTFRVGKTSVDGLIIVSWYFDPTDAAKLSFTLRSPSGTVYTSSFTGGTTFELAAEDGYAEFQIPTQLAGREGVWTAEVTANSSTTDYIEFESLSESTSVIEVDFQQANLQIGSKLIAAFSGNGYPISAANVIADIFNTENGEHVLKALILKDDGLGADDRANDGIYSIALSGLIPAGNYTASVVAETTSLSVFSSNVMFARGAPPTSEATGLLTRVDVSEFQVTDSDANFKPPISNTNNQAKSGQGGGCSSISSGNDASLILLALIATLGYFLRMRRQRVHSQQQK